VRNVLAVHVIIMTKCTVKNDTIIEYETKSWYMWFM